jgi:phage terminase large subunit-like protein
MTKMILEQAIGTDAFQAMREDPVAFVTAFDSHTPWDFQAEAMRAIVSKGEDGKYEKRIAVFSTPRQNGKSTVSAWVGLFCLFVEPDVNTIVSVALDVAGARIIFGDARRFITRSDVLMSLVDPDWGLTRSEVRLKDGRHWLIKSADAIMSRGLRPDVVLYDEAGWAKDRELYDTLSAGQAAADNPLTLITSTVGPVQMGLLWDMFQEAGYEQPV